MAVKDLHRSAMKQLELAVLARVKDPDQAFEYYLKSYELELQALELYREELAEEPTRSILIRSTANLALIVKKYRESEKLASEGLAGDPPIEIANELRDIFQEANFHRHLELKGIELTPAEVQLSLTGDEVGHGVIKSDEFLDRLEVFEKMAFRTADRLRSVEFKEKGRRRVADKVEFAPYISTPRAASFAVTLRFGKIQGQTILTGLGSQTTLIDDILENIRLLNEDAIDEFNKRMPDEAYRRNFIALTKKLAPDGERVRLVGFTVQRGSETIECPLTKINTSFTPFESELESKEKDEVPEKIELRGVVSFAVRKKNQIKITDDSGSDHLIHVPEGLMSDVVKPFWGELVIVKGVTKNKVIELEDIDPVS